MFNRFCIPLFKVKKFYKEMILKKWVFRCCKNAKLLFLRCSLKDYAFMFWDSSYQSTSLLRLSTSTQHWGWPSTTWSPPSSSCSTATSSAWSKEPSWRANPRQSWLHSSRECSSSHASGPSDPFVIPRRKRSLTWSSMSSFVGQVILSIGDSLTCAVFGSLK